MALVGDPQLRAEFVHPAPGAVVGDDHHLDAPRFHASQPVPQRLRRPAGLFFRQCKVQIAQKQGDPLRPQ